MVIRILFFIFSQYQNTLIISSNLNFYGLLKVNQTKFSFLNFLSPGYNKKCIHNYDRKGRYKFKKAFIGRWTGGKALTETGKAFTRGRLLDTTGIEGVLNAVPIYWQNVVGKTYIEVIKCIGIMMRALRRMRRGGKFHAWPCKTDAQFKTSQNEVFPLSFEWTKNKTPLIKRRLNIAS